MFSKLLTLEKVKKNPPKYTFALQNLKNKISNIGVKSNSSSRVSSGNLNSSYSKIMNEGYENNRRQSESSISKLSFNTSGSSKGIYQQIPAAVAVSNPSIKSKKYLKEYHLNHSTEVLPSMGSNYQNMDIIFESGEREDLTKTAWNPKNGRNEFNELKSGPFQDSRFNSKIGNAVRYESAYTAVGESYNNKGSLSY